jgi:hypothetical protein
MRNICSLIIPLLFRVQQNPNDCDNHYSLPEFNLWRGRLLRRGLIALYFELNIETGHQSFVVVDVNTVNNYHK